MIIENSKTNKLHRVRSSLVDKRYFKDPNKNMALTSLIIYYT